MNIIRHYLKKLRYIEDSAFTLIELLVVIAIIGTLSTIAFVSLQSAQDNADDTKDISQLRSIELALIQHNSTSGGYPDVADATATIDCVALNTGAAGTPAAGSIEAILKTSLPTLDFSDANYFYCSDTNQSTLGTNTNSGTKYVLGVQGINENNEVLDNDGLDAVKVRDLDIPTTLSADGCGGTTDTVYCLQGGAV